MKIALVLYSVSFIISISNVIDAYNKNNTKAVFGYLTAAIAWFCCILLALIIFKPNM